MKDRNAVSTLKGYFYQFDFSILQLLTLENMMDKVTIEGIEDVDITTINSKLAIQCKYYEGTEYNHSEISEAIKFLLMDFAERKNNGSKKIKYMLYGYYAKGQEKLSDIIDVSFLKSKFLTHKRKKKDTDKFVIVKEYELLGLTDKDLEEFLELLKIDINAKKLEQQLQDIYTQIIVAFKCTAFEAEHYYYNNALKTIKSISVHEKISEREISKKDFLNEIDNKEILFNQWFYLYRTQKEIFKKIRKEYFTALNIAPYERFFLLDVDQRDFDIVLIKDLIYLIIKKWAKCTKREPHPFCPYLYLHNILHEQLAALKKELYRENIIFIDGFPFLGSDFYAEALALPANHENMLQIKIINEKEVLSITVSLISRLIFEYGYYYKRYRCSIDTDERINNDIPILLVYEEAHKYVPRSELSKYRSSQKAIERIAKEGRKYGITLMLASQRPSEISETIFSQCNNFIAMRLTNPNDQGYVKRLLPDTLGNLIEKLPSLSAGEALLIGEAIVMPSVVQIDECKDNRPSSNDIPYWHFWKEEWKSLDFEQLQKEGHQ